jgi:hypothetical protein
MEILGTERMGKIKGGAGFYYPKTNLQEREWKPPFEIPLYFTAFRCLHLINFQLYRGLTSFRALESSLTISFG